METVKVDLQKLQILNDRIAQTIDALNQVRLSVHGLTHTNPYAQQLGQLGYGQPQQQFGYAQPQQLGMIGGFGGQPFSPFAQGLQHTSPWGMQPYGFGQLGQVPFGFGQGIQHTNPWGWNQPQQLGGLGIQHTTGGIDPFQAVRLAQLAQVFPNAMYGVPPVAIY